MEKITYVVIDDEASATQMLKMVLSAFKEFVHKRSFTNPQEAVEYLQKTDVDMVFIDEELPNYKLGHLWIHDIPFRTEIVIVTGSSHRLNEASSMDYDNRIIALFNKPVSKNQINTLVTKYAHWKQKKDKKKQSNITEISSKIVKEDVKYLFAYHDLGKSEGLIKVYYKDIIYVQSDDRKVLICSTETTTIYQMPISLASVGEDLLLDPRFVKLGRSYIISVKNMYRENKYMVSKYTDNVVPIPRRIWKGLLAHRK